MIGDIGEVSDFCRIGAHSTRQCEGWPRAAPVLVAVTRVRSGADRIVISPCKQRNRANGVQSTCITLGVWFVCSFIVPGRVVLASRKAFCVRTAVKLERGLCGFSAAAIGQSSGSHRVRREMVLLLSAEVWRGRWSWVAPRSIGLGSFSCDQQEDNDYESDNGAAGGSGGTARRVPV